MTTPPTALMPRSNALFRLRVRPLFGLLFALSVAFGLTASEARARPDTPLPAPTTAASPEDVCRVRVGVSTFAWPNPNFEIIEPTLEVLRRTFRDDDLCVERLGTATLERKIREGEVHLFLSSAGLYRRAASYGVRDIASVVGPHIANPNEAEGTVFVVKRERLELGGIETLRGLSAAANLPSGFTGFLAGVREAALAGYDPEHFFSRVSFLGRDQKAVLDAVLAGTADVGMLRACTFEELINKNPDYTGRFRVAAQKHHEGFACLHSSELYPSWVMGVTRTMPPELAARAAAALLSMPQTKGGLSWGVATDFSKVDALYRDLRIGPYEFLRHWTLARFWEEYGTWVLLALLAVAGLAVHSHRADRLVERRTLELKSAWEAERALEREGLRLRERMSNMQKAGVIGQVSSLVAHELGQPIAAILLYSHGILRALEDENPERHRIERAVLRIRAQGERASAILEKVRGYAKSRRPVRRPLDLSVLVAETVKRFCITSRGSSVEVRIADSPVVPPPVVLGDALELELVVANLLKNAAEALAPVEAPLIKVSVEAEGENAVRISVVDNGPVIAGEKLAMLSEPLVSEKSEGLGLGLNIVKTIVESHNGTISFARGPAELGLRVAVVLPRAHPDAGEDVENETNECQTPTDDNKNTSNIIINNNPSSETDK